MGYDALGNITSKPGVGAYSYDPNRPHVLTQAGANTYTHDANGNMFSGAGKSITWNQANLPTRIEQGNASLSFGYGPERARFRQRATVNGLLEVTFYIGGLYEKVTKGSLTTHRHYIQANGSTVALYIKRSNGDNDLDYLFGDHLGSIDTITHQSGEVIERLSYDAWGQRRPQNWDDPQGQLTSTVQDRGFTGHEHLDDVNLIHMNGRVYDPSLGRFVSADPTVQYPKYSQSLNRYSYVVNNPLSYTDPSGFGFFSELLDFSHKIDPIQRNLDNIIAKSTTLQQIGGVAAGVASVYFGPWVAAAYSAHITNLKGGSTFDIVKAGAISGAAAYAGGKVAGSQTLTGADQFAAGIFIAGTAGVASGGDVGTSFAVAAFTVGASAGVASVTSNQIVGTIVAAAIGGTASELSGGKFANGAITGAFGYALARAAHAKFESRRTLTFASEEELRAALAGGKVTIGARPLDVAGGLYKEGTSGGYLDVNNIEVLHEQVFYLDAKGDLQNIGFTSNGFEIDANFPKNISSYRFEQPFTPNQSINAFMKSAVLRFLDKRYGFIGHNCQHFADTVRGELQ